MKKCSVIFSFLVLFSPVSFADGSEPVAESRANFWQTILSTSEKALTQEGFEILQKEYPAYFGHMDSATIASAGVTTDDLLYVGEHTCPDGDSRMRTQTQRYHWCEKSMDGQDGLCRGTLVVVNAAMDPCA